MPRRKKTTAEQYAPYLRRFMQWKHGRLYDEGHIFTQEELLAIRPIHLVRYMSLVAYDKEEPGPDDKPTHRRSTGLEFFKKAVSSFMPNRNVAWNVESNTGNPTMSVAVNDLLKKIKKAEVRKQGKKSNAKRDLKRAEFRQTVRLLEKHSDFLRRQRIPTMIKLQVHIIGRANDISNIEAMDLQSHDRFRSFALQMAVSWSKNVLDERNCPDQILLGCMDPDFCVLLSLGCWKELLRGG
jgi:hypothetical protein